MNNSVNKKLSQNRSDNLIRTRIKAAPVRSRAFVNKEKNSKSQFLNSKSQSITPRPDSARPNTQDLISLTKRIFQAKCRDLMIASGKNQEDRFLKMFHSGISKRQLNLQDCSISAESCEVLSKILPTCDYFAYLNFSNNKLGDLCVLKIANSLLLNENIVSLDLSSTDISSSGSVPILESLSKHRSLVSLDLSSKQFLYRNRLSPNESLSKLLLIPTLTYLNLSNTSLKKKGLKFLCKGLKQNSTLKHLNINSNKLKGIVFKELSQALVISNVDEVLLADNKIEQVAIDEICDLLSGTYGYSALTRLSIAGNHIKNSLIYPFLEVMVKENFLLHLNLENNEFSGYLDVLERFLSENKRLRYLNLSNCCLRSDSIQKISDGLLKNTGIQTLILKENKIKDQGAGYIAQSFMGNKTLKKIDLSINEIRNPGGLAIASSLVFNKSIRSLNFSDNELKDEFGEAMINVFTHNFYIIKLKIELNPINGKYINDFNEYIKRNKRLNEESAKKQAINLRKFDVDVREGVEENAAQKIDNYLEKIKEQESYVGKQINEVALDSRERIKEIKYDLDNVYNLEKKKNSEKEKKRTFKKVRIDKDKRIQEVYEDLIRQVSNLESMNTKSSGVLFKNVSKGKIQKVVMKNRRFSRTPMFDVSILANKKYSKSKSPISKVGNVLN